MAEGFVRALKGDEFEPFSAGIAPKVLDGRAVKVMAELGIDISNQRPKHVREFKGQKFDYVVTVCDGAREQCPFFPGGKVLHRGFDDPPRLAAEAKTEEEALAHYRRVRDEIKAFVEAMPDVLDEKSPGE